MIFKQLNKNNRLKKSIISKTKKLWQLRLSYDEKLDELICKAEIVC